jgi:ElaB/YqjD/DUF883 family membrane-anchored ribosome-binding protein
MDMAKLLKSVANVYMAAAIGRLVARDLAKRVPYGLAGAATAVGLLAGLFMGKRRIPTR